MKYILSAIAVVSLTSCSTGSTPPEYMQEALFNLGLEYAEQQLNIGK